MRKWRHVILYSLLLMLPTRAVAQSPDIPLTLHPEYGIRQMAFDAPLPGYPEEARAAGAQGLAIAAVHFEADGNYADLEVLASPHPAITKSVTSTIRRWRLKPIIMPGGMRARAQGELRFRYVIDGAEYRVELLTDAEQKKHSPQYERMEKSFRYRWDDERRRKS